MTYAPITVAARRTLLDALAALEDHRAGLVLVGAQAIYLYTGDADVPIATTTRDSDVALIPARLAASPTVETAMARAEFSHDPKTQNPGEWSAPAAADPPVDLLVPASLDGGGGRRSANIPPHSKRAARPTEGLEAAAVSHGPMTITSLEPERDDRAVDMLVSSPAGLIVAKAYKIGERAADAPDRLVNKDAHDLYRLLRATDPIQSAAELNRILGDAIAGPITAQAIAWLRGLADSPEARIPGMASQAVEILTRDPETAAQVAAATWALVADLLDRLE